MGNLFWGALIIAIGLFRHQSIFDGLGLFWIGRGVLELASRGKEKPAAPGDEERDV